MMKRLTAAFISVALICIGAVSNVQAYEQQHTTFRQGQNILAAYHIKPDDIDNIKGVILFVHGDGAMPFDAHGYYEPIWQELLNSGYAVFSWDKPGVGDSSGNWLDQSMKDRQNEVHSAIAFVKKTYAYKEGEIGLMGFSQAGWVVPAVTKGNKDIGFMIGVGFAVNWIQQSWYMTKIRLQKEGATHTEIEHAYQEHIDEIKFWKNKPTYEEYIKQFAQDGDLMSEDRFKFVRKNITSDLRKDFQGIVQPVLILLGQEDLNVNTQNTQTILNTIINTQNNVDIQTIPYATHALLKHPEFGSQTFGLYFYLKLIWQGKDAFAPPFFNTLTNWIKVL